MTRYSLNGIETRMVQRHRCTINIRKNDKRLTTRALWNKRLAKMAKNIARQALLKDSVEFSKKYSTGRAAMTYNEQQYSV